MKSTGSSDRSDESGSVAQRTLTGDEMDAERVTCEYGDGLCGRPAEFHVSVLDYELGQDIDLSVCPLCKDEFGEWIDPKNIRPLSRTERWHYVE